MAHYNTARSKSKTGVQAAACAPVFSFPAPYCARCARCRSVSPELADTLATFTVGGLIQNLKRYLTEPNLDPDALTAEMTTVFEHLWNSFTSEAV